MPAPPTRLTATTSTAHARPISYGYLRERFPIAAYQTIFALCPGSAEMPSAARPFSAELVARLVARGVIFAPITLHTGVSSQEAHEAPQAEWFEVSRDHGGSWSTPPAAAAGGSSRSGTTATRAIESATGPDGTVAGRSRLDRAGHLPGPAGPGGRRPDHRLAQPRRVAPAAGRVGRRAELTQRAYDAAVAERYLWHEFGDSGLLLP